jgi:dTMP kinase
VAYQGIGRQRDLAVIRQLVAIATQGLKPALTLLFDLPVEESQNRLHRSALQGPAGRLDRIDSEPWDFHERVRTGYLSLAAAEPDRFRVFDACCDIETLHQKVIGCLPSEVLNLG